MNRSSLHQKFEYEDIAASCSFEILLSFFAWIAILNFTLSLTIEDINFMPNIERLMNIVILTRMLSLLPALFYRTAEEQGIDQRGAREGFADLVTHVTLPALVFSSLSHV